MEVIYQLDKYERQILEAFEQGELKSVGLSKAELERYKAAVMATITNGSVGCAARQPFQELSAQPGRG